MPWNNKGGGGPWGGGGDGGGNNGGGNGNSPWGQGGPGQTPPDLEEVLRKSQDKFKKMVPGGVGGSKAIALIVIGLVALWGASGFYKVEPNEEGIELVFGKLWEQTESGLNWNFPAPIGSVIKPDVTRINEIQVGYRGVGQGSARGGSKRDVPEESLMITGDENIVDIDFVVQWKISDPVAYLFNLQNPDLTVKMAAESVMRDIIGRRPIEQALTGGKQEIEQETQVELQALIQDYAAGIEVRRVQLLDVGPPSQVIDSFIEVQRARQDKDRVKNEAEAYRNDVVPRARGEAAQLLQQAEAYRAEVVNRATGDANRFNSVYQAYSQSKDVTTQRIYLETMEEVLGNVEKVIIDKNAGGNGVVPYLPLPEVQNRMNDKKAAGGTN